MSKEKSRRNNVHLESTDINPEEKERKPHGLLARILKEHPWPVIKDQKTKVGRQNVKANITHHNFDEDTIGEGGGEGDFSFRKGFEVLSDILSIYRDYIIGGDTYNYISHLTGVTLKKDEGWPSFLEKLGICISSNNLADEDPCYDGDSYVLTVDREMQGDLLNKLKIIKNRLDEFVNCDRTGKLEIQDHCEVIADLVDVYGPKLPISDLMSLIDYRQPPIGYLTTMLLINWLNKQTELSSASCGFGPTNDYMFLNWLAKDRQKEIMTYLQKNMTEDIEVNNIYEYLKKLSAQYVNERVPSFGGPHGVVARNRYKYNKELFTGFYMGPFPKNRDRS